MRNLWRKCPTLKQHWFNIKCLLDNAILMRISAPVASHSARVHHGPQPAVRAAPGSARAGRGVGYTRPCPTTPLWLCHYTHPGVPSHLYTMTTCGAVSSPCHLRDSRWTRPGHSTDCHALTSSVISVVLFALVKNASKRLNQAKKSSYIFHFGSLICSWVFKMCMDWNT